MSVSDSALSQVGSMHGSNSLQDLIFYSTCKKERTVTLHLYKIRYRKCFSAFCKTEAAVQKKAKEVSSYKNRMLSDSLRTFRIAVAGTGEYTAFWGDDDDSNGSNAEDALAAVVSTINRINVIFERDLNIRLELVSDINLLFEDSNTDPFVSDFSSELQEILDNVVGDEAYDVGHLFDFGEPDGDAGCIGCVCTSGQKGQGYSIHPFRDIYGGEYRNDYFDLDYAGHEIGHQFGAYHTFSHQTEGTG
jgi:hypothetical protein